MENLKRFVANFGFNKETIVSLVLLVAVAALLLSGYFTNFFLIIPLTFLGIMLLVTMMVAGHAIMKSLVRISAGLTLLFFLAQTYCSLETSVITPSGMDSLKGLFAVGLLCMLLDFFLSLYRALIATWKKLNTGDILQAKKLTMGFILLFTLVFMYWIFQVMNPILHSLCVSK
jgi:hypothetical protein